MSWIFWWLSTGKLSIILEKSIFLSGKDWYFNYLRVHLLVNIHSLVNLYSYIETHGYISHDIHLKSKLLLSGWLPVHLPYLKIFSLIYLSVDFCQFVWKLFNFSTVVLHIIILPYTLSRLCATHRGNLILVHSTREMNGCSLKIKNQWVNRIIRKIVSENSM